MIDCAVIVEPRLHLFLKPVIDNILRNINIEIPIIIFHSINNKDFIIENYREYIESTKIRLILLKEINLTISQYNNLLTSLNFWDKIIGENILIFQTDSCLCRHMNTFDFTKYKDYGFVGAPSFNNNTWRNGGLSLRKKSHMILAIKDHMKKTNTPITIAEDKFFTVLKKDIVKPCSYILGTEFSVEKYYNNNPLGLHKTWKYITKEQWNELKNKFNEINLTFGSYY